MRLVPVRGLATALTIGSSVIAGAAHAQAPATAPGQALPGDVRVARTQDSVTVDWPSAQGERAQLVLSRAPGQPTIEANAIAGQTVLGGIDQAGAVTVRTRDRTERRRVGKERVVTGVYEGAPT